MAVKTAPMPKRAKPPHGEDREKNPSGPVRIDSDLAWKINVVATMTGRTVSEILSPYVRTFIEREYVSAITRAAKEVRD